MIDIETLRNRYEQIESLKEPLQDVRAMGRIDLAQDIIEHIHRLKLEVLDILNGEEPGIY